MVPYSVYLKCIYGSLQRNVRKAFFFFFKQNFTNGEWKQRAGNCLQITALTEDKI